MKITQRAIAALACCISSAAEAQTILSDPGVTGPPLEIAHLYYDQWPTGITVSSTGRKFSNYPAGLDPGNTNNGTNNAYAVAELTGIDTEIPYPSVEMNNPPGGAINRTTGSPSGANYQDHFIGVQSVVIDALDRLWVLDTGRAIDPLSGVQVLSTYGGPKLVGIDLTTNTVFQTILFPQDIAFPDSFLNDVRFDLRASVSSSGKGVAYITDSSTEGRNGIIIVDLGTAASHRHLDLVQQVRPDTQIVPFIWGEPIYFMAGPDRPFMYSPVGSDGIALSADGEELFFGSLGSRYLYSVPTALLRSRSATSELMAQQAIRNRGQKGMSDGFESDSNGYLYIGNSEQNAVNLYNAANGTVNVLVRDPRINWVDTMSVTVDGYLYFSCNQLHLTPAIYPGTDRRTKPWVLFKVKLPDGGGKVILT
ncbi:major royal jelly protein [Leptodontidium sp. MPI-SDFR-AT-0119]|nr:major royal jelly protein [Leptodontidium sp. MPI-SDFR-AT-0119]